MGKKSKGGKTEAKEVKQAMKPSQKEKDQQSKEEKAAQRLAIHKEKNLQRRGVINSAMTTEAALVEELMQTVQGDSQSKQAAARAQLLADQAKRQKTEEIQASIAKSKLQREKDLEEERAAQAGNEGESSRHGRRSSET
jgi:hypothetical protein